MAYFIEQGYEAGLEYMDQIKAAILAKEPGFTFHPYRQQGYTKDELKEIVGRAEQRVGACPRDSLSSQSSSSIAYITSPSWDLSLPTGPSPGLGSDTATAWIQKTAAMKSLLTGANRAL